MKKMSNEELKELETEYVQQLKEVIKEHRKTRDTEYAHSVADDIIMSLLSDLGFKRVVTWYDKVDKWYS